MGDTFDATFEPVAKHHHWDGDREADGGRQQRLPDAGREDGGADLAAGLGELAEGLDHAEHGAEQAEQRRDAADHLEGADVSAQSLERLVAAAPHFPHDPRLQLTPALQAPTCARPHHIATGSRWDRMGLEALKTESPVTEKQ